MQNDLLTSLPTRSEFLRRYAATKSGVLVLLDIDGAAVVNGVLGHDAGDAAMVQVAGMFRDACSSAFVARLGGDEFVALFHSDNDDDVAVAAAEQIRTDAEARYEAVRQKCRDAGVYAINGAGPLTLSFAIVSIGWYGTLEKALAMADRAMWHAKFTGRNRTVVAVPGRPGIDALTGLLNRRAFEAEFERSRLVTREGFGVIYADIDGFKQVNDARGHDFGDEVLVALAKALQSNRGVEGAARFGGDEVTAMLPLDAFQLDQAAASIWQSLVEAAATFREPLTDLLAETKSTYLGPPRPPLGISMAAIWVPPGGRYSLHDVLGLADDMMQAIRSLKGTGHIVLRLPRV